MHEAKACTELFSSFSQRDTMKPVKHFCKTVSTKCRVEMQTSQPGKGQVGRETTLLISE